MHWEKGFQIKENIFWNICPDFVSRNMLIYSKSNYIINNIKSSLNDNFLKMCFCKHWCGNHFWQIQRVKEDFSSNVNFCNWKQPLRTNALVHHLAFRWYVYVYLYVCVAIILVANHLNTHWLNAHLLKEVVVVILKKTIIEVYLTFTF